MNNMKALWTEASLEVYKKRSMIETLKGYKVREDLLEAEMKKLKLLQKKRDSLAAAMNRLATEEKAQYWSTIK